MRILNYYFFLYHLCVAIDEVKDHQIECQIQFYLDLYRHTQLMSIWNEHTLEMFPQHFHH